RSHHSRDIGRQWPTLIPRSPCSTSERGRVQSPPPEPEVVPPWSLPLELASPPLLDPWSPPPSRSSLVGVVPPGTVVGDVPSWLPDGSAVVGVVSVGMVVAVESTVVDVVESSTDGVSWLSCEDAPMPR